MSPGRPPSEVVARLPDRTASAFAPHVIFFDGVCGLCDRLIRFVLDRDGGGHFRFAPLQGTLAARELLPRGGRPDDLDTVVVLTAEGRMLRKSQAVLFVLRQLGGVWSAVAWLRVLPTAITDVLYDLVARRRYRLFGRMDACRLPTPSERDRFLD